MPNCSLFLLFLFLLLFYPIVLIFLFPHLETTGPRTCGKTNRCFTFQTPLFSILLQPASPLPPSPLLTRYYHSFTLIIRLHSSSCRCQSSFDTEDEPLRTPCSFILFSLSLFFLFHSPLSSRLLFTCLLFFFFKLPSHVAVSKPRLGGHDDTLDCFF